MNQDELEPGVVRQLMFNRMLACVRLAEIDHVTIARFDAETGTIEGSLAGVSFVINVSAVPST